MFNLRFEIEMLKRYGTLMLGVALVGLALFLLIPERAQVMQLFGQFWPLCLVLAGILRVTGYLLDRHPRSPVGGMMLTSIGGVLLAAHLRGDRAPLQIFGRYWFWLLLAFVAGRVLLQYTRRPEAGVRTRAFGFGSVLIMLLIAGGGLAANRLSTDQQLLTLLRSRLGEFHEVRDHIFSEQISVEDEPALRFELAPDARLLITNPFGDVEVRGGSQAQARLIKRVKAANEEGARELAKKIHLQIQQPRIMVIADEMEGEIDARLILELPAQVTTAIAVERARGAVKFAHLRGDHTIRGAGRVEVADNLGRVTVEDPRSAVQLSGIEGDVRVASSSNRVRLSRVTGTVRITAENGSIEADELDGAARIEATRDVTVRNFRGPLEVATRVGSINLSTDVALGGDLKATNQRGRIRVRLPEESSFRLDASTSFGRLRLRGFEDLVASRQEKMALVSFHGDQGAPLVQLRSIKGDILLESWELSPASQEEPDN